MDPVWVTSEEAAQWIREDHGVDLSAATIRQWARRGTITAPKNRHGRYDLLEIFAVAQQRGLIT